MDKQPIRILHVIGSMNRGGAETMIMNFYRHIDRTKLQFDFVENTDREAAFDREIQSLGGRIYRCPHYRGINHLAYVKWWLCFLQKHAGDYAIIHGHLGSTAAIYLPLAKRFGLYTIAHSHNTNGTGFRDLLYSIYSYPTRYIADWFFACSRKAGSDRYGEKVVRNPEKFAVLNNAIDTKKFDYDCNVRRIVRKKLQIEEDAFVVGHVGRFVSQKNHPFLIDVFSEISRQDVSAKLLLVGKEDSDGTIRKKVQAMGLTDRVIFAGVQEDMASFYQAMDLFMFPSLFEGLGIVAVEAQASGLPCIISDRVSEECIRTRNLVKILSLDRPAQEWASAALEMKSHFRKSCYEEVASSGYDVHEVSKWLENFYLEKASKLA